MLPPSCKSGSSPDGAKWVPLPLEPGVPNRAGILYSLWRAGYTVDANPYPGDVQNKYFEYIGNFWRRQVVDENESN